MLTVLFALVLYQNVNITLANKIFLKAQRYIGYENMVEMNGAISITPASNLLMCVKNGADNDKCLTFFFNSNSEQCVMHSEHFYFRAPSMIENGWNYYITKDVTGRCPATHFYFRSLDYCYTIEEIANIDPTQIKMSCSQKGGQLSVINSSEKYGYIVQIVEDRPPLLVRVPIQGSKSGNQWILDDGTPQKYFNWYPGQPDFKNGENCLGLKTDNLMFDVLCNYANTVPGVFVCEI